MSTPSTWTGSEETRKDTSTLSESWKKVHTSKGERGLESAHFVGHSLGGRVAAELAAEDPDCVSKMVLADAAGVAARRGKLGRLAGVSGEISQTPAKLLELVVKGTLKAGVTEVIRVADHLAEEDIEGKLTRIRTHTLVIWGRNDRTLPLRLGRKMRRRIPGSRFEVLPRAGHLVISRSRRRPTGSTAS